MLFDVLIGAVIVFCCLLNAVIVLESATLRY